MTLLRISNFCTLPPGEKSSVHTHSTFRAITDLHGSYFTFPLFSLLDQKLIKGNGLHGQHVHGISAFWSVTRDSLTKSFMQRCFQRISFFLLSSNVIETFLLSILGLGTLDLGDNFTSLPSPTEVKPTRPRTLLSLRDIAHDLLHLHKSPCRKRML